MSDKECGCYNEIEIESDAVSWGGDGPVYDIIKGPCPYHAGLERQLALAQEMAGSGCELHEQMLGIMNHQNLEWTEEYAKLELERDALQARAERLEAGLEIEQIRQMERQLTIVQEESTRLVLENRALKDAIRGFMRKDSL